MKWAGRLAGARRRAGLTQQHLASLCGVPQSTVGRIEAGLIEPRAETLDRLLRACGRALDVTEDLGKGEDRTLIREQLRLSPRERFENNVAMAEFVERLRLARPGSR